MPPLPSPLRLYTLFHLNLAYSSIEEQDRERVIACCYWPLLRLAKELRVPIGIEATGHTLETINVIDSRWVEQLCELMNDGLCEFVGSGYAQIIGPLVPARVNAVNLCLGNGVYQQLLGHVPRVALVNEQAYSAGLVKHYLDAGYDAIVMDWDNPARSHSEWEPDWKYFPQYAVGPDGAEIQVIWNVSMAFQKFQRYAHGQLALPEYLDYLDRQIGEEPRAWSLYGNDAEVFDFRPGRYETESIQRPEKEWERIRKLFLQLKGDGRFQLVSPSEVLTCSPILKAGHRLCLESVEDPIPVKKQPKYNILRWAVTGRDDAGINRACWELYEHLKTSDSSSDEDWRELCYLWSSDFRTHITAPRWRAYRQRITRLQNTFGIPAVPPREVDFHVWNKAGNDPSHIQSSAPVSWDGYYVCVETQGMKIRLNSQRGLAIEALWFKTISPRPLIGTLGHGYFDDIAMGADFYSGHLVLESPGRAKLTDLKPIEPDIEWSTDEQAVLIRGRVSTPLGVVIKTFRIHECNGLGLEYDFEWEQVPPGALRLGHITLFPGSFDRHTMALATHNGGSQPEYFSLGQRPVDQGRALSLLHSGRGAFGMTEGTLTVGDDSKAVVIDVAQATGYVVPLLTAYPVGDSYFWRVSFSAKEHDDTTTIGSDSQPPRSYGFSLQAQSSPFEGMRVERDYAGVSRE